MTIRQFLCAVRGHDQVLHFYLDTVRLRCTSCGWDTFGWARGPQGYRQTQPGDPSRHRLTLRHLLHRAERRDAA